MYRGGLLGIRDSLRVWLCDVVRFCGMGTLSRLVRSILPARPRVTVRADGAVYRKAIGVARSEVNDDDAVTELKSFVASREGAARQALGRLGGNHTEYETDRAHRLLEVAISG